MTLAEKVLVGWAVLAGLCSALLAFAAHRCRDPLRMLDGSKLACALDDRDRALMLDAAAAHTAAYEYAEREAMEWDYVLSLPSWERGA